MAHHIVTAWHGHIVTAWPVKLWQYVMCRFYLEAIAGLSDLHTGMLGFAAVLVIQTQAQAPKPRSK